MVAPPARPRCWSLHAPTRPFPVTEIAIGGPRRQISTP
jgi:hypothetical protein